MANRKERQGAAGHVKAPLGGQRPVGLRVHESTTVEGRKEHGGVGVGMAMASEGSAQQKPRE